LLDVGGGKKGKVKGGKIWRRKWKKEGKEKERRRK